jgi:predicted  nucleic acid-binding Zn-ribbon protein
VDEKEEDKSEESFQRHLIFYQKLNKKIKDIQNEIQSSNDAKILKHLNERIDAIELDKTRIRKLFPDVNNETWKDPDL